MSWRVTLLAAALVAKQMRATIAAYLVSGAEKLLQEVGVARLVVALSGVSQKVEVAALANLLLHLAAAEVGGVSCLALRCKLSVLIFPCRLR